MATLELTISPKYVKDWGPWEAIRELLQNWKDGMTRGFDGIMEYDPVRQTLELTNEGVTLTREQLLFGSTTKDGDASQIGHFGEGFKLAWLVLCRNNMPVVCRTGEERWIPQLAESKTFGTATLHVKTTKARPLNAVQVTIAGVTPQIWAECNTKCAFLPNAPDRREHPTTRGLLLRDEEFSGRLFGQGIYVGKLPGEFKYGYDLLQLQLDRDRKIADPWLLPLEIARVLEASILDGTISPQRLYYLLALGGEEARALKTYGPTKGFESFAAWWKKKHGDNAHPVEDFSVDLGHYGMKGVREPPFVVWMLEGTLGTLEQILKGRESEVTKLYGPFELEPHERGHLLRYTELLERVLPIFQPQIVDFRGENYLGEYENGTVRIARKLLGQHAEFLATAVHEVAHEAGGDGTLAHVRRMEEIFSSLARLALKEV